MKVAISSEGPNLTSAVSRRFGATPYFLLIDLETETLTAVENPGATASRGAGVQAVVLLLSQDADVLLTRYCSPTMRRQLEDNGVTVFSGLAGIAQDILRQYKAGDISARSRKKAKTGRPQRTAFSRENLRHAARRSLKQVFSMLPVMAGVVLLVGLFNSFVSRTLVQSVFSGRLVLDTFRGTCAGSILAGNPISSYIIGGGLLQQGVSLSAVTAFMLAWVTVGLVQLPAEAAALGYRFALQRNVACFLLTFPIAIATALIMTGLTGGPS